MNNRPLFHKCTLWISLLGALSLFGMLQSFSAETKALQTLAANTAAITKPVLSPLEIAQQRADAYHNKFKTWSQGQNQSFEPNLTLGHEAGQAILAIADDVDDAVFDQFQAKMPGYILSRYNVLAAVPNAAFLAEQAKAHGQAQDVAFFQLMSETLNGYWPVLLEQIQDDTVCSRFGSHDFVRLYGSWKQFQQQYPKAYVSWLKEPNSFLLAYIEDQLLNSQSACDGPDAVADEFETFIKTYPTSNLVPKIKRRLEALRQNKSDIAFFQGVKYIDPASSGANSEPDLEK